MNFEKVGATSSIEKKEIETEQSRARAKRVGSKVLKATCAPEDYVLISSFANSLGANKKTVISYFEEKGIQLESFRTENGKNAKYLPPELCEEFIKNNGYRQPPEGYISVNDAAEALGVGKNTIRAYYKKQEIDKFKGLDDPRPMQYLSPKQFEEFRRKKVFKKAPDDYLSISEFAAKHGVGDDVVRRFFQNNDESNTFRGDNGLPTRYLSLKDQQSFVDHYKELISKNQSLEKAPDGYLTIPEFAKQLRVDRDTIDRFLEDEHIELDEYKGYNSIAKYLSPDDQNSFIKKREDILLLEEPPDDYLTINEFVKVTGTSRKKIENYLSEQGFTPKCFKGKDRKPTTFLPPFIQKKFLEDKKDLLSLEKPPDGFLSIGEFASLYNLNRKTVENHVIDELPLFISGNGSPAKYLSLRQQAEVMSDIENSTAGTSFPENVMAYYLTQSGQQIEQGVRPDWLKNPDTNRKLEIDILLDSIGVGIEYDGKFYHQDIERDLRKDRIAREKGYRIIHIREDGCPELPEGSICINRKDNSSDDDLSESVRKCFQLLNIPEPDIDVFRDKKDIMAFMRKKVLNNLDSARTFEELSVAP